MSGPTPVVRAVTYEREQERCVSCGRTSALQYQHRRAEGMGGRLDRPKYSEGLTSCATCNPAYEAALQNSALRFGWKVRAWVVDQDRAHEVPVYFPLERTWYRLTNHGERVRISRAAAVRMMHDVCGEEYERWEAA